MADRSILYRIRAALQGGFVAVASEVQLLSTYVGVLLGVNNSETAFRRFDATGVGAPIVTFTGAFSATAANIDTWFGGRQVVRLRCTGRGASQAGALPFDLPGTTALNTAFDQLVSVGLPERLQFIIEYTGDNASFVSVRPRVSPSPQIINATSITIRSGVAASLEVTRDMGTISDYEWQSIGQIGTAAGGILGAITLINPGTAVWNANASGVLPTIGVARGNAYRVANAPSDGSGRFGEIMQNGDWVVWSGETFTSWAAEPHQWFVIAAHDVRRITALENEFLNNVSVTAPSDRNTIVRNADYAATAGEIRLKFYASAAAYDPADLNTTGDIDAYIDPADQTGRLGIRLPGTLATLVNVLPTLYVFSEDASSNFTLIGNLQDDFTHQGDFTTESDYLSNDVLNYTANDTWRVYVGTVEDRYTIPDLDIFESNLVGAVQRKLNAPGHDTNTLPPALAALNNQADIFNLTHGEYRSNNRNLFVANAFAFLKNAPTTLPPTAGLFANEINGSAQTVDDPIDLTRIQNVGSATNNVLTGVGINNNSFGMNFQDRNNWHLVIGGWMYYETLPTEFTPILRIAERGEIDTVYRDIFGIDSAGIQFKVRDTVGATDNVSIRHPLSTTDGFIDGIITASVLTRDWRIYTAKSYFIQVRGFNAGMETGGQAQSYLVTDIDVDQAATTLTFNLGVGTQSIDFSFDSDATLYGGSAHIITAEVSSLIGGIDEIRIEVLDVASTVAVTSNNTYTNQTISEGHVAAARLMRYIASFRSIGGVESGNLECVITFFGYDSNGNPTVFDDNTFDLSYPALDLEWDDCVYGGAGIHQNVQGFFLNPDTPLLEFPRHSTLRDWLSNHDDKTSDWDWGNIQAPNQDIEAVHFPEYVNFSNLILVAPDNSRFRLAVQNDGTINTEPVV